MTPAPRPDRGAIGFGEKLLALFGEGRFVATYKYAVLLGLIDLCMEHSTRQGAAPGALTTEALARKVIALYWPHAVVFRAPAGRVLRQNAGRQAGIVAAIEGFRERHAPDPSAPLARARAQAPERYERLVREVEWKLVQMPLPRLQVVGNEVDPFLYRIGWDAGIRKGEFRDPGFDGTIRFVGAAGDHLVRLSGLLRPLIQREWARMVSGFNADLAAESGLEDFLFGVSRAALAPIRDDLRAIDAGRCFYCGAPLREGWEVDHFVPWARHPDDGLENLVSSDPKCNGYKLDHLASVEHVERWLERASKRAGDLRQLAAGRHWELDPGRSSAVARSIYLRLPDDVRLWQQARLFVPLERRRLEAAFAAPR